MVKISVIIHDEYLNIVLRLKYKMWRIESNIPLKTSLINITGFTVASPFQLLSHYNRSSQPLHPTITSCLQACLLVSTGYFKVLYEFWPVLLLTNIIRCLDLQIFLYQPLRDMLGICIINRRSHCVVYFFAPPACICSIVIYFTNLRHAHAAKESHTHNQYSNNQLIHVLYQQFLEKKIISPS